MSESTSSSKSTPTKSTVSDLALASPPQPTPPSFRGREFPTTFRIRKRETAALVSIEDLQDHLQLLGAFHQLRRTVQEGTSQGVDGGVAERLTPAARWSVFVTGAVHRFQLYIFRCVDPSWRAGVRPELPPLDCLLVWHAYALNPR